MTKTITMAMLAILFATLLDTSARAGNLRFSLRRHGSDLNMTDKPAQIQYTDTDEKESSYSIDAAIKADFLPRWDESLELGVFYERHKNTLLDKEQNLSAVGGCALKSWGDLANGYRIEQSFSIKYQADGIKDADSVLGILEFASFWNQLRMGPVYGPSEFSYSWLPSAALEYERDVESGTAPRLESSRFYFAIDIALYPLFEKLDGRFTLYFSFKDWQKIGGSEVLTKSEEIMTYGMTWRLTEEVPEGKSGFEVTLDLSWTDGSDPRENKADQKYHQLGLRVRY